MNAGSRDTATELLLAWGRGDAAALDRLMPLVHDELRRLARTFMNRERAQHTLQATALVNEVYLRLIHINQVQWQNRAHFFAMAARLMRRVLIDLARARGNQKRGGEVHKVTISEALVVAGSERPPDLLALDEAMTRLAAFDPRRAAVVELRFFGGLTVEECAEALAVSPETVKRDWRLAKLWLLRELTASAPDGR